MKKKILLTGANGQLGTVLAKILNDRYGVENVILSDLRDMKSEANKFIVLNVLDKDRILEVVKNNKITEIYHLAAILSANAEKKPLMSWDVNFKGTLNIMDIAHEKGLKLFYPSSIAVFGDTSPKSKTPQNCALLPTSNYGMAKVGAELWSNYYYHVHKTDIRAVRFPGIISYQSPPGGGTTDYAIEMYVAASKGEDYTSFISSDTKLPMMYIDDALRAVVELMESNEDNIKCRTAYNLAAISFTPAELHESIKKYIPNFKVSYKPDFRQEIADSWTETIDDSQARNDWSWKHAYGLDEMTKTMIENLIKINK